MRGFELVGRLAAPLSMGQRWHYLDDKTGVEVVPGDVVALSPYRDGPLRPGLARVDDVRKFDADLRLPGLTVEIPAAAAGDYVFVARAIGEDAFG